MAEGIYKNLMPKSNYVDIEFNNADYIHYDIPVSTYFNLESGVDYIALGNISLATTFVPYTPAIVSFEYNKINTSKATFWARIKLSSPFTGTVRLYIVLIPCNMTVP